jgi:osmotically-inducible protein OsmY
MRSIAGEGNRSTGDIGEKSMEDRLFQPGPAPGAFDAVLPETVAEAERLAASIERAVQRETGRAVRNLSVEVGQDGVLLKGRCDTFYCKQLAQHAAMAVPGGDRLTNAIEVA